MTEDDREAILQIHDFIADGRRGLQGGGLNGPEDLAHFTTKIDNAQEMILALLEGRYW